VIYRKFDIKIKRTRDNGYIKHIEIISILKIDAKLVI